MGITWGGGEWGVKRPPGNEKSPLSEKKVDSGRPPSQKVPQWSSRISVEDQQYSGYVRKYFDVKNRAFLPIFMRDFYHLYAKLLSGHQSRNTRCENRAFYLIIMCVFSI